MAKKEYRTDVTANESISKYKLLSAYGAPGSLIHTKYGSIIISCIEEWGFLNKILKIDEDQRDATKGQIGINEEQIQSGVKNIAKKSENGGIIISNDKRLLESLREIKDLPNLNYIALIPDIEISTFGNKIKDDKVDLAIPSSYMPKVFSGNKTYKSYNEWFTEWTSRKKNDEFVDKNGQKFHPPKFIRKEGDGENNDWIENLKQDNIVLLCEHGHISDFPWAKFLRWRNDYPEGILQDKTVDVLNDDIQSCCGDPNLTITSNTGNASGFEGKFLRCVKCNKSTSLKGLMNVKIKCRGHKPWENKTGEAKYYSGNTNKKFLAKEKCNNQEKSSDGKCMRDKPMKVALTTGNNIYYSRIKSSIYLHDDLFKEKELIEIEKLTIELDSAIKNQEFEKAIEIRNQIEELQKAITSELTDDISDSEQELIYRHKEFSAFHKDDKLLNQNEKDLKTKDVTGNLDEGLNKYFDKILRIDNLKITSVQLDFSRGVPIDDDAESAVPKNIFRNEKEDVIVYPGIENYGEGLFFSFDKKFIKQFSENNEIIEKLKEQINNLSKNSNSFNEGAIKYAQSMNWELYLVHTFSHLIMRELEFKCGYPTASLSERIYVSNKEEHNMFGCLIYTSEGGEGSMGGLIAQTTQKNLNALIISALQRATICNSDPLCWESEGQGLFDLNFASCFSCSLVSETSCEHRNLYLDRKIVVDFENGFFKYLINK